MWRLPIQLRMHTYDHWTKRIQTSTFTRVVLIFYFLSFFPFWTFELFGIKGGSVGLYVNKNQWKRKLHNPSRKKPLTDAGRYVSSTKQVLWPRASQLLCETATRIKAIKRGSCTRFALIIVMHQLNNSQIWERLTLVAVWNDGSILLYVNAIRVDRFRKRNG